MELDLEDARQSMERAAAERKTLRQESRGAAEKASALERQLEAERRRHEASAGRLAELQERAEEERARAAAFERRVVQLTEDLVKEQREKDAVDAKAKAVRSGQEREEADAVVKSYEMQLQELRSQVACLNGENAAPASLACAGWHIGNQCHTQDAFTLTAKTTYIHYKCINYSTFHIYN
jgi:chromosome segregation ATPase